MRRISAHGRQHENKKAGINPTSSQSLPVHPWSATANDNYLRLEIGRYPPIPETVASSSVVNQGQ
tara:strand:- start:364 stop:558 length:195 start_codon:yes stop_codon:yes gene_type:complete